MAFNPAEQLTVAFNPAELVKQKNSCYAEYKSTKNAMQDIEKAKININLILQKREIPTKKKKKFLT